MQFSIIVPVYNVEKYLEVCVESILKQTFQDYEVILVDDGSTDMSGKMCEKWSHNDKFIIIHQKNMGLSSARNTGLKNARGDYIVFLDSDDFLDENALLQFHTIIEERPIDVIAGYGNRFQKVESVYPTMHYRKKLGQVVSGQDFYGIALRQKKLSVGAPYYVYKSLFLKKNNLFFFEGLLHEDELWNPMMLYCAESVFDIKYRYYNYRTDNKISITKDPRKKEKRATDRLKISQYLAEWVDDKKDNINKSFMDNISAQYMYAVYDGKLLLNKEISIDRFFPIRYARHFKYILKATIFAISPNIACKLRNMKSNY